MLKKFAIENTNRKCSDAFTLPRPRHCNVYLPILPQHTQNTAMYSPHPHGFVMNYHQSINAVKHPPHPQDAAMFLPRRIVSQEAPVCSSSDKGWCCYVSFHPQAAEQASIVQKVDQPNPPPPDDVHPVEAFKLHPPLYVHDGQVVQCDQLHSQLQNDVSPSFHALRLLKKQPQHRKLTATFFLHLNLFTMLKLPTIISPYLVLTILCMQPVMPLPLY